MSLTLEEAIRQIENLELLKKIGEIVDAMIEEKKADWQSDIIAMVMQKVIIPTPRDGRDAPTLQEILSHIPKAKDGKTPTEKEIEKIAIPILERILDDIKINVKIRVI